MKLRAKQIILFFLIFALIFAMPGCGKDKKKTSVSSTLTVTFLDVGQGDCAFIECDGEYMLIDAGPKGSSDKVRKYLLQENVYTLKYLVLSHLDEDHIGGILKDALRNVSIEYVLSNQHISVNTELERKLIAYKQKIPQKGDTFQLGSAKIEVISVQSSDRNDSLVIMIHHGKTRFLFTGDIEAAQQKEVADTLLSMAKDIKKSEVLIKMPHHGAYNPDNSFLGDITENYLATMVNHSYAKYFVISVGKNNRYGHPHKKTIEIIEQALPSGKHKKDCLFRTDENGDIVFTSNGKKITPS